MNGNLTEYIDLRIALSDQHVCSRHCHYEQSLGNLWTCRTSGQIHVCDQNCNQKVYYDNYNMICRLSKRLFPIPLDQQPAMDRWIIKLCHYLMLLFVNCVPIVFFFLNNMQKAKNRHWRVKIRLQWLWEWEQETVLWALKPKHACHGQWWKSGFLFSALSIQLRVFI